MECYSTQPSYNIFSFEIPLGRKAKGAKSWDSFVLSNMVGKFKLIEMS